MQQHEGCPTARKVADVQAAAIATKQWVSRFRRQDRAKICRALRPIGEAVNLLTMCPFLSSFPSTRHANGFVVRPTIIGVLLSLRGCISLFILFILPSAPRRRLYRRQLSNR